VISGRSNPRRFWRERGVWGGSLREVDWRFLLRQRETPRALDLSGSKAPAALASVTWPAGNGDGEADLAVLGFPSDDSLARARRALVPGGEVACLWRAPRPGAVRRARARLEQAGFADVRFYRTGPQPGEMEVWLPLDDPAVASQALAQRPPHSRREAILRRAWQVLAPVYATARLADAGSEDVGDELPDADAWVLLTGGPEDDAKVVGFPYAKGQGDPDVVVKFARIEKAGAALEREARFLRELERERATLGGVPRLRAEGRRAGQVAIAQDAIRGRSLNGMMDPTGFARFAPPVTRWLIRLAGSPEPQPASAWIDRLVTEPLAELESSFADRLPAGFTAGAGEALAGLGALPLAWEHRDFGPWNVVLTAADEPAVIDWEDAESRGLPGLDLAYFLASAAFTIDGVPPGAGRVAQAQQSNARLLDPNTQLGEVAAACVAEYRTALGIGDDDFRRLRLLCWLAQALIACRRLTGPEAGTLPAAADADLFIALAADELRSLEDLK
jgi:hypothetical protein